KDWLILVLAGWKMRQTDQAGAAAGRSMMGGGTWGGKPHARGEKARVHRPIRGRAGVAAGGACTTGRERPSDWRPVARRCTSCFTANGVISAGIARIGFR